jgi:uncharacterized protein
MSATMTTSKNLVESKLRPGAAIYRHAINAGDPWIYEIKKGQCFRIIDLHGNQAVDTLFYNAHDYSDRYSAQDTIQQQRNIYLTTGTRLMSTAGTVLLTIVALIILTHGFAVGCILSRLRAGEGEKNLDRPRSKS